MQKVIYLGILSDQRAWNSRSPQMHENALKEASLKGSYQAFEVKEENLKQAISGLEALRFRGLNITVPYKEAVIPHLAGLSQDARKIGAVNTLVSASDGYWGYNTDADGFLDALKIKKDFQGSSLIFGSGGASRAIIYALIKIGLKPYIYGRNKEKAKKLAQEFKVNAITEDELKQNTWDLLVNTSSASTESDLGLQLEVASKIILAPQAFVMDINYNKHPNFWQQLALKQGATFQDGYDMLASQARLSFKLWTGIELDKQVFLNSLTIS